MRLYLGYHYGRQQATRHRLILQIDLQAQKEVEALRAAVSTQGREREVAAQAQARLAAAKKQMKELEWSSEVRCNAILMFLSLQRAACWAAVRAAMVSVTDLMHVRYSNTTEVPAVGGLYCNEVE